MEKTILFKDIHPFIRFAQLIHIGSKFKYPFRNFKSYDCRLFYVYNSKGIIHVDNVMYEVSSGDLFIWQPGTEYSLINHNDSQLNLLGLSFDYTQDNCSKNLPIGPVRSIKFDDFNIIELIKFTDLEVFNKPLYLKSMNILEEDLLEIKHEYNTQRKFYENKISSLLTYMLSDIARVAYNIYTNDGKVNQKADMIINYIHQNYNKCITCESISKAFNFHPNYINRIIVSNTGKSLYQYLLMHRISHAIDLIQNTNMQISEIAYSVGFKDVNHFSKQFRIKTGKNPLYFRRIQK